MSDYMGFMPMTEKEIEKAPSPETALPGPDESGRNASVSSDPAGCPERRAEDGILIGDLITGNQQVPYFLPLSCLRGNTLIAGNPGSGKSVLAANFLHQAYQKGIHFIVFEPNKITYRSLAKVIDNLQICRFDRGAQQLFRMNPFIPPDGISVQQYMATLSQILQASMKMPAECSWFMNRAIETLYHRHGWLADPAGSRTVFGMREFTDELRNVIRESGYSQNTTDDFDMKYVLPFDTLSRQYESVFETTEQADISSILQTPTVFEMDSVASSEAKKIIVFCLLLHISLQTASEKPTSRIGRMVMLDEAEQLFDDSLSTGQYDGILSVLIREAKVHGLCYVMTSLFPSRISFLLDCGIIPTVIAFRLSFREAEFIADRFSAKDKADELASLETGIAYISSGTDPSPRKVLTRYFPPDVK